MSRLSANTKKPRINRHTDQRGIILVVALMVTLILALLGTAFLTTSGTEHQIAKNDQEIVQALYVAEGGLQTALNQMNLTLVPSTPGTIGPGQYTVTVTDASTPTRQKRIVATGHVPTVAAPRAVKRITVLVCDATLFAAANLCSSPFQDALFGLNGVTVSASTTDSYDCANGAYGGSNIGSNGDVGSNGTIDLKGATQIHGDAVAGVTVLNPALVIPPGTVTNGAPLAAMPDVPCPAAGYTPSVPPGTGVTYPDNCAGCLTVSGGSGSLTLSAPGTYYFNNVKIQGGARLAIASGGHVDIYIGGKLDASGGSLVNGSSLPTNLTIWGCGTNTSAWTFSSGNGNAYLGLYAPNHSLTLSGGGSMYGSFIAEGTITESGGTHVHYDECLGRQASGKFVPTLGSWTELAL